MFVGDSYGQAYTPDGRITSWIHYTRDNLPLLPSNYVGTAHGGDGFGRPDSAYKFSTAIDSLDSDASVKYVIIGGGYNDIYSTAENIMTGMAECQTLIASKFPNAEMVIAFIGNTTDPAHTADIVTTQANWENSASVLGIISLQNTNVLDSAEYFTSDKVHPNAKGQQKISRAIIRAMNNQLL